MSKKSLIFALSLLATALLSPASPGRDEFGGLLSIKGSATGHFHLEEIGGRICLVTPDGHGFFSLGITHIQAIAKKADPDLFKQKYNRNWLKMSKAVHAELMQWGYNTAGYGAPAPLEKMMPYTEGIYLTKNANYHSNSEFFYPDVFDPEVQEGMRIILRQTVEREKGNPNLIGYYWTDTPQWDMQRARKKRGTDWVSTIRGLPSDAPGRQRYEQFLSDCQGEGRSPDDTEFLRLIARELYKVLGEETRRLAPDALILGERYLVNDHPDAVLEEALPYIDVLSIQPGAVTFNQRYLDRLHKKTGKPILLCDHQCSFPTPEYPKTMWQQLESETAVGEAHVRYLQDAVRKPYIIGYHRCQYIDRYEESLGILKQGIIRQDGTPYEILTQSIRKANASAMELFEESMSNSKGAPDISHPGRKELP
jgi:hypothetical protein